MLQFQSVSFAYFFRFLIPLFLSLFFLSACGGSSTGTGGSAEGNAGGNAEGNAEGNAGGSTGDDELPPLAAPTNLKVIKAGSKLKLSWAAHSKASAYNLYYAEQSFSGVNIVNYQSLTGAKQLADINGTQKELNAIDFKGNTTYYIVLTAKTSSQESGVSNEQSIKVQRSFLNDTGITLCGDYAFGGSNIHNNDRNCIGTTDTENDPIPKGQDGHYGTGKDGSKGKVFSKVVNFEDKCVIDEHTGLMWEVKQDTTGLHNKDHTYKWYNPDSITNGGHAGNEYGSNCGGTLSKCNTQAFVKEVNKIGLCGHKDWRLPTITELHSIVDYSRIKPSIDTTYFPHTKLDSYWSSSPYADDSTGAFSVAFISGVDVLIYKLHTYPVRLVRIDSPAPK